MTIPAAGRLVRISRHPVKGHGREDLTTVALTAGACLPWDRHWAVAHDAAKLVDGWNPCVNFARGAKAPALMAISAQLDESTGTVRLTHPDRPALTFRPDDAADLPRFVDWVSPLNPPDRAQPARIVTAGRGMTDSDFPSVAILSMSSLGDLSHRIGADLSPDRWRGNLWLEGFAPFAEFDWIGRDIRIGTALLRVRERITRCLATAVDPNTGLRDIETLGGLQSAYGHQDFGVYASVVADGTANIGDQVALT
jgi:uncharacterized protein